MPPKHILDAKSLTPPSPSPFTSFTPLANSKQKPAAGDTHATLPSTSKTRKPTKATPELFPGFQRVTGRPKSGNEIINAAANRLRANAARHPIAPICETLATELTPLTSVSATSATLATLATQSIELSEPLPKRLAICKLLHQAIELKLIGEKYFFTAQPMSEIRYSDGSAQELPAITQKNLMKTMSSLMLFFNMFSIAWAANASFFAQHSALPEGLLAKLIAKNNAFYNTSVLRHVQNSLSDLKKLKILNHENVKKICENTINQFINNLHDQHFAILEHALFSSNTNEKDAENNEFDFFHLMSEQQIMPQRNSGQPQQQNLNLIFEELRKIASLPFSKSDPKSAASGSMPASNKKLGVSGSLSKRISPTIKKKLHAPNTVSEQLDDYCGKAASIIKPDDVLQDANAIIPHLAKLILALCTTGVQLAYLGDSTSSATAISNHHILMFYNLATKHLELISSKPLSQKAASNNQAKAGDIIYATHINIENSTTEDQQRVQEILSKMHVHFLEI